MTEPATDLRQDPRFPFDGGDPEDRGFADDSSFVEAIAEALAAGDVERVREMVLPLHYADGADLIERLGSEERRLLVAALGPDLDAEVISGLDETVRDEVIEHMEVEDLAAAIVELDSDDALALVEELEEDEQRELLDAIPAEDRTFIEEGLTYPDDSAGRLMQREVVTVPAYWTVGETIDHMRNVADEKDDDLPSVFYDIFVVDPKHRPVGAIPVSRLLQTKRPVRVADIMEPSMRLIAANTDQEEVAFLFRQRDLVSAPVIDDDGRLVGAITIDDVVDVIDEEHEEDIMRLGGVQSDDLYHAVLDTTKSRFTWLLVNLGTAVLASLVIGLFEATLEQMVALAVLMPIVASMGGNAGTQTLTVAVRGLATREVIASNAFRLIGKELLVGVANGLLFAVPTAAVAWVWFGSPQIAIVIGAAMIINLIVAGLAGSVIPVLLERAKIDPAIASGVFLTTVTDVVGFFGFLGLAALFLL